MSHGSWFNGGGNSSGSGVRSSRASVNVRRGGPCHESRECRLDFQCVRREIDVHLSGANTRRIVGRALARPGLEELIETLFEIDPRRA